MAGRPREFDREHALLKARNLFWRQGYEGTNVGFSGRTWHRFRAHLQSVRFKRTLIPAGSLSPHIVIKETGFDIELVKADLRNHTFNQAKIFLPCHPRVPYSLAAPREVLTVASAVIQYLADLKSKPYWPNGTLQRINRSIDRLSQRKYTKGLSR
jgi:hypothetical protein